MFYDDKDVDPFEHEIEFDRLCDSLTGKGADTLVVQLHASQMQLCGDSKLVHLHAVAELAWRYAELYYTETDFNEQRYRKLSCKLSGLLHEAMDHGTSFEDVVNVADETVARIVSSLTADCRLPAPKRRELLMNRLGLASESAQLVKLADMQHECHQLLGIPNRTLKSSLLGRIESWREETLELLGIMAKIKESMYLTPQLAGLKANLHQLGQKCKAKLLVK